MKVIARSSSLVFFFGNLLLGLPIRRRLGNSGGGMDGRGGVRENFLSGGSGERRLGWKGLAPQQENRTAEPVAEQKY